MCVWCVYMAAHVCMFIICMYMCLCVKACAHMNIYVCICVCVCMHVKEKEKDKNKLCSLKNGLLIDSNHHFFLDWIFSFSQLFVLLPIVLSEEMSLLSPLPCLTFEHLTWQDPFSFHSHLHCFHLKRKWKPEMKRYTQNIQRAHLALSKYLNLNLAI